MEKIFIDKIAVPKAVITQLTERLDYNTAFLAKQPGLVKNMHYQRTDAQGNLVIITVAIWESNEAVEKAKAAVQEDYRRQGIDLTETLKAWGVTIDRGLYEEREK